MKLNDLQTSSPWTLARRAEKMNPSVIREILKVTEKPGIISFAGGLPSPKTFPIAEFAKACEAVLRGKGEAYGQAALQYASSEGYAPLREMVAAGLPWKVDASQVLITTGSQQGLDLIAKVLIDADSRILVETPAKPLGRVRTGGPWATDGLWWWRIWHGLCGCRRSLASGRYWSGRCGSGEERSWVRGCSWRALLLMRARAW